MGSFWKRQLPMVVAASLVFASSPLTAAANAPAAPSAQLINVNATAAAAAPASPDLPVSGQVIVKFRQHSAGFTAMSTASAVTGRGGAVLHEDRQSRMVVKLPAEAAAAGELIAALRSMPDVAYVENNEPMKAFAAPPSDVRYGELWGLARLNVAAAWDRQSPVAPVVVAVVDTGVDNTHPDLDGRVLPGFNAMDGTTNSMDDHGHGTHVSGTIAAKYNNTLGITGVAGPADVRILPVKVLDASGTGSFFTVAQGIDWAADHGAQVINLSLGGSHSDSVQEAILRAEGQGVVVVVAAGNDNTDTAFVTPADVPGVVAVAALDMTDHAASFSNHGDQVDVIAPGVDILSTVPGGNYASGSGTSMASPHVAGLAALLKAAHPQWSRWAIQACIFASADPATQSGYGYGVPQADKAIACNPATLDSKYALKLEGPDPDDAVSGSPAFWFDAKPGGDRVVVRSSTGMELGAATYTAGGLVPVVTNLSGLAPGPTMLTATLADAAGAVIGTHSFPVTIGSGAGSVGLTLSTSRFTPTREKLAITTALKGSTRYDMAVRDSQDRLVKMLVNNRTYTGPVLWDGKGTSGRLVPTGNYYIEVFTDAGERAVAAFALRVPPTPLAPALTVASPAVNVATVDVAGRVNPGFAVEAQFKAPGAPGFTMVGMIAQADADGRFSAPFVLTGGEGLYEIQIRGADPEDKLNTSRWSTSARVQFDGTAPVVRLTSPTPVNGVVATNQTRLMLTGTTEAGARVTATAGPNSRTAAADARGAWKLELPLQSGANSLALSAVDAAGNQAAAQHFDVTVDATAPQLTPGSLTLTAGTAALTPTLNRGMYGFATQAAAQYLLVGGMSEQIDKIVPGNARLAPTIAGDSFSVDLAPGLRNGNNALWFDLYDLAGNKTRLSVAVTLDGTKPKVTVKEKDVVLAPKPDAGGVPQPVPATFTVTASEPLRELRVLYDNGGSSEGVAVSQAGSTDGRKWTVSMTFPAADANWAIQFVGVDLAGNVGEAETRTGRRVSIDATAPELSLTSSTDSLIFSDTTALTVSGTATDAGAGLKSITVGRTVVRPNQDGSFSTRVALSEGKQTAIPVVVLDLAGNQRTETIRVVAKSKVNLLTVSPRLSPERQLSITGRTDAPIRLPDETTVGVVPVTVVITDSQNVARSYAAEVKPDGSYSLNVDAAGWVTGRCSITVTGGIPAEFDRPGTAFRTKTVTGSLTIK